MTNSKLLDFVKKYTMIIVLVLVLSLFAILTGGSILLPANVSNIISQNAYVFILATGMPTIKAVGSSLLAVGSFGLATALNYAASGLVDWPVAFEFIAGGIIGGILGMMLANRRSAGTDTLNRVFAALIFVVAAYVLYRSAGVFIG